MSKMNAIMIKNKDGEFKPHYVNDEVYQYIKQLEMCIKEPELSKLKEKYPKRFNLKQ